MKSSLYIITGPLTGFAQATIFYSGFRKACLKMCENEGTGKPQPCLQHRSADQTFKKHMVSMCRFLTALWLTGSWEVPCPITGLKVSPICPHIGFNVCYMCWWELTFDHFFKLLQQNLLSDLCTRGPWWALGSWRSRRSLRSWLKHNILLISDSKVIRHVTTWHDIWHRMLIMS